MALSIVSNQAASIATRSLGQSNDAATATAEKLSSGKRINSAKDDAAGSAIAARLSAEVAGLQQAGVNAGQASSMLQIADGAFQNVEDILTRAKSLSVQAGSEQISNSERAFLDQEFQALKSEIERISNDTEFNGTKLVNGGQDVYVADAVGTVNKFENSNGDIGVVTGLSTLGSFGVNNFQAVGVALNQGNVATSNAANPISNAQIADLTFTVGSVTMLATAAAAGANFTVEAMVNVTTTQGATGAQTFTAMLSDLAAASVMYDGTNAILTFTRATDVALMAGSMTEGEIVVGLNSGASISVAAAGSVTMGDALIVGSDSKDFSFKVGTGTSATEDEIAVDIGGIALSSLGIDSSSISTKTGADNASDAVSRAIDVLQQKRSEVGAAQNRLDFAAQNVELTRENQEAARSELEDLNVAKAITEFSQQQLLVQAGTSTLSQANQLPQNLLQLFR